jgi:hypothetical protein
MEVLKVIHDFCSFASRAGGKMPTQRSRLTRTEDQEYRSRLSRLEQLGIPVGCAVDPRHEPARLTLEQTPDEFARIYELPSGQVAVVVPATITVLKSGILITHVAMVTPWEDWPLDLWDPKESSYYTDLIGGLCHFPPTVLNPWLERDVPLRPRRVEGVIIAQGYSSVPPECHDETLVTVKLLLMDERRDELSFEFGVRVDRSVVRKCERRQRERREFGRPLKRSGLFGPQAEQRRDQKSASRDEAIKQPHIRGEHDATGDPRTPKIN